MPNSCEVLTENQIKDIRETILKNEVNNDYKEKVNPDWCFFPVHLSLSERIHYEFTNNTVVFHIECDASTLRKMLKEEFTKKNYSDRKRFIIKSEITKEKKSSFKDLYNKINPILEKYVSYLDSKYNQLDKARIKTESEQKSLEHYNYLEGFSNKNNGINENDHTRILMSLLKYKQNNKFVLLESFIKYVDICINTKQLNVDNILVNKGFECGKNILDGLIVDKNRNAIIIENKVCGAADQPNQINRYISSIKTEYKPIGNIWVIYMTREGGHPSNYNKDQKVTLKCINYRYDILPWLKEKVLPIIKYSSIGWAVDNYIDYLEKWFKIDSISRIVANKQKETIFNKLNISNSPILEQFKKLNQCFQELNTSTKYNQLRDIIYGYLEDLYKPLYDEFERSTIRYFRDKRKEIIVNNKLYAGYIQVYGKDWNRQIHFEWYPVTPLKLFFETKPLDLCIHIEGNNHKAQKKSLSEPLKYEIRLNNSIYNMMEENSFYDWLCDAYDKVFDRWTELEKIAVHH